MCWYGVSWSIWPPSGSVIRLIGWLLVHGSLLAHVLIDKVEGFVPDRLRTCHRMASSLAVAHLFGGYVVAQLEEGGELRVN